MFKSLFARLFAAAALVILAVALNPSPERHRSEIKTALAERSPVARMLGVGSLTAFLSTYRSLGVASYTVANERTISLGAFGVVFVLE